MWVGTMRGRRIDSEPVPLSEKEKVEPFKASSRNEPGPKKEDLTLKHAKES